jgi:hypothetical protein
MSNYEQLAQREVIGYWRTILATLKQRGLLRERPAQGGVIVPHALAVMDPERCMFVLDMLRLGGVSRERWLDRNLWGQWRAALSGRRVVVADGYGLVIVVGRQPGPVITKRLPAVIPLTSDVIPDGPYTVCLGMDRRGPVVLDLAGNERAILCGGAPGGGKSNLMQSIILQLATKHGPDEFRVAIVDTKQVDFGPAFGRLPHLFMPVGHTMDEATALIGAVEQERLRRQAVMAAAGVNDWRKLGNPFPLLLAVIDEAADFARTPAMDTLVESARKGRAFGVSFVVGTQLPSARVIDPQVRAALETAIAFRCRTHLESQAILGVGGAEKLDRPGLALAYLRGKWVTAQTFLADGDGGGDLVQRAAIPQAPALSEIETALVRYAVGNLGGAFIIGRLYEQFGDHVSKRQLTRLGQRWELRGWLTTPAHATDPRRVTDELRALCDGGLPPGQGTENGDRVIGVIGGDRASGTVTGVVIGRNVEVTG